MDENSVIASENDASTSIPKLEEVESLSGTGSKTSAEQERKALQLERDENQSHNIRRFSAYGALGFAFILYVFGLIAISSMLGFFCNDRFSADMWHISTVIVMALFTVPTLLVLAVLRASTKSPNAKDVMIVHEHIGQMVLKFLEKLASK